MSIRHRSGIRAQGKTAEALQHYREALQTKGIVDSQLRGVIEASLSSIRAQLEGDPTKFGVSLTARGPSATIRRFSKRSSVSWRRWAHRHRYLMKSM